MAVADTFDGVLGGFFSGTLGVILVILIGLGAFFIAGGAFYYFYSYRRKYDITAKIISVRHGENKIYFDKAAIINDKKNKMSFLKLQKSKLEIELPRFDIFYHTNKGDYVELLRKSERNIRFLSPPKIDREWIIKKDGKLYPVANLIHREIENDLSWIVDREKKNKAVIDPESFLLKLLAYAPQIISAVMSFMILYMVLRYAPDLLNSMKNFAQTIQEASKKQETEVIGALIPLLLWKLRT